MASSTNFLAMVFYILSFSCFTKSLVSSYSLLELPISSISAAPSFLPEAPQPSSPTSAQPPVALPPDVMPVFPSPRIGAGIAPASTLPTTIPSSPSPPNPDKMVPDDVTVLPPLGYSASAAADTTSSTAAAGELVGLHLAVRSVTFGLMLISWLQVFAL